MLSVNIFQGFLLFLYDNSSYFDKEGEVVHLQYNTFDFDFTNTLSFCSVSVSHQVIVVDTWYRLEKEISGFAHH